MVYYISLDIKVLESDIGVACIVEMQPYNLARILGALQHSHIYREIEIAPVEDTILRSPEQVMHEIGLNGIVPASVAIDHHIQESVPASVLNLPVEVEELPCSPRTL